MKNKCERRFYRVRIVNIDLSRLQKSYFLGFTNEHLITQVNIQLTEELLQGNAFSIKFSIFGTKREVSSLEAENGIISYTLPRDITGIISKKCQVLFQVTAYLDGVIIGKSPVVNGYLDEGLEAEEEIEPTIIPLTDEIHMNSASRHNHSNKAAIDLFSIGDDDKLLWDNEPVGTDIDLSEYALKSEIPTVPTTVSAFTNDAGYLTQHQDLSLYALKAEIPTVPTNVSAFTNDVGYLTEHQSLSNYALKSELPKVPTAVSAFENDKGYLTQHQSLAEYAKKVDLPTIPTKISAFENDKGYLTQHQDLSLYAKKAELPIIPTNVSAFTNDKRYLSSSVIDSKTISDSSIVERETEDYVYNDTVDVAAGIIPAAEAAKYISMVEDDNSYTLNVYPLRKDKVENTYVLSYNIDFAEEGLEPEPELGVKRVDTTKNCWLLLVSENEDVQGYYTFIVAKSSVISSFRYTITQDGIETNVAKVAVTGSYNDLADKPASNDLVLRAYDANMAGGISVSYNNDYWVIFEKIQSGEPVNIRFYVSTNNYPQDIQDLGIQYQGYPVIIEYRVCCYNTDGGNNIFLIVP